MPVSGYGIHSCTPQYVTMTEDNPYCTDTRPVRHKDIKPQNILIEAQESGTNILFTDFGIAVDFGDKTESSKGTNLPRTERYCAPEVANGGHRDTRSDFWSLGCVFLEIMTVLKGRSLDRLGEHNGNDHIYYVSTPQMMSWLKQLEDTQDAIASLVIPLISSMVSKKAKTRPRSQEGFNTLFGNTIKELELRTQLFCQSCIDDPQPDVKVLEEEPVIEEPTVATIQSKDVGGVQATLLHDSALVITVRDLETPVKEEEQDFSVSTSEPAMPSVDAERPRHSSFSLDPISSNRIQTYIVADAIPEMRDER